MAGAPEDLQNGGNLGRVWTRIDQIDAKLDKLTADVAFMRGKIEGAQVVEERKVSFKSGAVVALIGASAAGFIEAILHFMK